jgi:hypothetical protein
MQTRKNSFKSIRQSIPGCDNTILASVASEWDFNQMTKEIVRDFLIGRAYFFI